MFHVPHEYRMKTGAMGSEDTIGNNGAFDVPFQSYVFGVIASDGMGWEHVSISLPNRCPNWAEMCFMKNLFWDSEDCVVQYHPPQKEYVNNHSNCLHLWRQVGKEFKTPPTITV